MMLIYFPDITGRDNRIAQDSQNIESIRGCCVSFKDGSETICLTPFQIEILIRKLKKLKEIFIVE